MDIFQILGPICSAFGNIPRTFVSGIWFWIELAFKAYWLFIIPIVIFWVIFEIITRWNHGFNSDNGFTPAFNKFVGGGVFLLSEKIINLILEFFSGPEINCVTLFSSSFYLIPFLTTGLFLNVVGFWVYWKIPFINNKNQFIHKL